MINEADIILADEPTASLDWKHGHEVIDLLSRYSKENHKCVVIASHDLRIANFADRIITLTDGYIAE